MLLGGGGFIGTALATRLQREKTPVISVGRNNTEMMAHMLPKCSTVVHLASSTTPGSSANHPHLELDNLSLTLRLLEMLQRQPQTHLIYFSSGGTVYGNPAQLPVAEDCQLAPLSYHGVGKVAQENFCRALRAQGQPITILRPSNAYGPGQTVRQGFGLIRTMLEHARLGTTLEIWGDGENVRDYVYIDDIVEAVTCLIRRPQDSGTYNLSSGFGYSVNQVISAIERTCATSVKTIYRQARRVDVHSVILDHGRLTSLLNWEPRVGLFEGVNQTWQWLSATSPCITMASDS